jgi:hypothetical protein
MSDTDIDTVAIDVILEEVRQRLLNNPNLVIKLTDTESGLEIEQFSARSSPARSSSARRGQDTQENDRRRRRRIQHLEAELRRERQALYKDDFTGISSSSSAASTDNTEVAVFEKQVAEMDIATDPAIAPEPEPASALAPVPVQVHVSVPAPAAAASPMPMHVPDAEPASKDGNAGHPMDSNDDYDGAAAVGDASAAAAVSDVYYPPVPPPRCSSVTLKVSLDFGEVSAYQTPLCRCILSCLVLLTRHQPKNENVTRYVSDHRQTPTKKRMKKEIEELVGKLKDALVTRNTITISIMTKQQLTHLLNAVIIANTTGTIDAAIEPLQKVMTLINTSRAYKSIGYYFQSIIAHELKTELKGSYVKATHHLPGLKSSKDQAAFPAFYEFVQKHYAKDTKDIESMLYIPIFVAEIGWDAWRRYMTKSHRHLIETALKRFSADESMLDWRDRDWVIEYEDDEGRRRIKTSRIIRAGETMDLRATGLLVSSEENSTLSAPSLISVNNDWYFHNNTNIDHWLLSVQHAPPSHCNLKLTVTTCQLESIRHIGAGEELTFDFGICHWINEITGINYERWFDVNNVTKNEIQRRQETFERMHQTLMNYDELLDARIDMIDVNKPEVERMQSMFVKIDEYLSD